MTKRIPFKKSDIPGPPLKIGDDFRIFVPPTDFRDGSSWTDRHCYYQIIGEDGDYWLVIKVDR